MIDNGWSLVVSTFLSETIIIKNSLNLVYQSRSLDCLPLSSKWQKHSHCCVSVGMATIRITTTHNNNYCCYVYSYEALQCMALRAVVELCYTFFIFSLFKQSQKDSGSVTEDGEQLK